MVLTSPDVGRLFDLHDLERHRDQNRLVVLGQDEHVRPDLVDRVLAGPVAREIAVVQLLGDEEGIDVPLGHEGARAGVPVFELFLREVGELG